MKEFGFERIGTELKTKIPLIRTVLLLIGYLQSKNITDMFWLASVCTAAVVLKNRCTHMNAMQMLINSILQHLSITVSTEYGSKSICK